jgi:hypothetical protein
MNDLHPTNSLRVRPGIIADKPVLVLQVLKLPPFGRMMSIATDETKWQDATIEDLSTIARITLGGLVPNEIRR